MHLVLWADLLGKFLRLLSTHEMTAKLKGLRKGCSENLPHEVDEVIEGNFQDIRFQLMKCEHESQLHQLQTQNEQLTAQNEQLTAQNEQLTAQNEQLTAQNKQLKKQLQKQQEKSDTMLERQMTKHMLTEQEVECKVKIRKLEEQLQNPQDEIVKTYRRQSS